MSASFAHPGIGRIGDLNLDDIFGPSDPGSSGGGIPDWVQVDNSPSGPQDFSTPYDWAMYNDLYVPSDYRTTFGTSSFPKSPPAGSGVSASDWAKLVTASSQALISGVRSTQTPYLIPGTNLIYDPATGKIQSSTGVTATQVGTSFLPMLGIAALGMLAIVLAKGKG
jgi:hypothetical protein